jgi:hypothetical protein
VPGQSLSALHYTFTYRDIMKKKLKTILEKVELLSWDCQIDDVKDELDEAVLHLEAALEAFENWENDEDEEEE